MEAMAIEFDDFPFLNIWIFHRRLLIYQREWFFVSHCIPYLLDHLLKDIPEKDALFEKCCHCF
jgi:hypothetical protein